MSIEIITISGYKTKFPDTALNGIRDARIQSAINLSFSYLDIKTGCAISQRWEIVEPTVGYLTEEQKEYVRQAMYVETQYVLSNNMDFSQGADQSSFGSLSVSSSRPERIGKEVCESALMYLQKAGLYDYLSFSSPTYLGSSDGQIVSMRQDYLDPTNQYVTYTVGDSRYVLAYKDPTIYGGKYLKVNEQGYIEYVNVVSPILENFYTKAECDAKFATFVYLTNNYYTAQECDNKYFLESEGVAMDLRLEAVEDTLPHKQDTLVSGTNIKTINGNNILGSGDITISGQPTHYLKTLNISGNTMTFRKVVDGTEQDQSYTPNFDTQFNNKLDKKDNTSAYWHVYGNYKGSDNITYQTTFKASDLNDGSSIMQRNSHGRSQVSDPTQDLEIANKRTVDNSVANEAQIRSERDNALLENINDLSSRVQDIETAKVQTVSASETNFPSCTAVINYVAEQVGQIETALETITTGEGV